MGGGAARRPTQADTWTSRRAVEKRREPQDYDSVDDDDAVKMMIAATAALGGSSICSKWFVLIR